MSPISDLRKMDGASENKIILYHIGTLVGLLVLVVVVGRDSPWG